jgi:coiled-coil domain-containing protein 12
LSDLSLRDLCFIKYLRQIFWVFWRHVLIFCTFCLQFQLLFNAFAVPQLNFLAERRAHMRALQQQQEAARLGGGGSRSKPRGGRQQRAVCSPKSFGLPLRLSSISDSSILRPIMEEAASRTARLQALRAAKERRAQANPDAASTSEPAAAEAAAGPKVIFRNYQPSDKSLQESAKLPRAGVVKPAVPVKAADDDNVLNVIAKKANWDLKRDMQPKLQKLERRTEVCFIPLSPPRRLPFPPRPRVSCLLF